jgi:hypothetical protein
MTNEITRFFQSYALSFNKFHNRHGNLFNKPFRRVKIETESQLIQTVIYIHANPLKHRLTKDFTTWKWSTWSELCSETSGNSLRVEVLEWFGGRDRFIGLHKEMSQFYYKTKLSIEE